MKHECNYQEVIFDNVKNIASIEQQTIHNSEKLDKVDEKLDAIIEEIQTLKIKQANEGFVRKCIKVAAIFLISLTTNVFWNHLSDIFK